MIFQVTVTAIIVPVIVYCLARLVFRAYFVERQTFVTSVLETLKEHQRYYEKE